MTEHQLLERITVNLGMLAAGDTIETILEGYPWLEREDIQVCLLYARRRVGNETIESLDIAAGVGE